MKAAKTRLLISRWWYRLFPIPAEVTKESVDTEQRYRNLGASIARHARVLGHLDETNPHLVVLGDYSILEQGASIVTHGPLDDIREVKVGDFVWIGNHAVVLPGSQIGDLCLIMPGSVVKGNVPSRSLVAGHPAEVVRLLTDEEVKRLEGQLLTGQPGLDPLYSRESPEEARDRHRAVGRGRLWRMKRHFQLRFLKDAGLLPSHYFMDIGCGTLRGGIPLIQYLEPGRYYGLDVRDEVLAQARQELILNDVEDKRPTLIRMHNPDTLAMEVTFDYIWAFSVFFHMTDDILEQNVAMASRHLKQTGILFSNVLIGENRSSTWLEFPLLWRSMEFYESLANRYGLGVQDIGTLMDLGHISGDEVGDTQRMLRFSNHMKQ